MEDDEGLPAVAGMGTGVYQLFHRDRLPGGLSGQTVLPFGADWVCCEIFDNGPPLVIGFVASSAVTFLHNWRCLTADGGLADPALSPYNGLLLLATRHETEKENLPPGAGPAA